MFNEVYVVSVLEMNEQLVMKLKLSASTETSAALDVFQNSLLPDQCHAVI